RAQGRSCDARRVGLAERVRVNGDVHQVRQVTALRLDIGVADRVADHRLLAGEFTNAGHGPPFLKVCAAQKPPENGDSGPGAESEAGSLVRRTRTVKLDGAGGDRPARCRPRREIARFCRFRERKRLAGRPPRSDSMPFFPAMVSAGAMFFLPMVGQNALFGIAGGGQAMRLEAEYEAITPVPWMGRHKTASGSLIIDFTP